MLNGFQACETDKPAHALMCESDDYRWAIRAM